MRVDGPRGATRYLEELLRDMWIPQAMAFIQYQLDRSLRKASRCRWEQRTWEAAGEAGTAAVSAAKLDGVGPASSFGRECGC